MIRYGSMYLLFSVQNVIQDDILSLENDVSAKKESGIMIVLKIFNKSRLTYQERLKLSDGI